MKCRSYSEICIMDLLHNEFNKYSSRNLLHLQMMMMMNCFCGMVDRRKAFSLISSRDHCQRSSPSRISDTPWAGFEPAQNLSSGLVEWSCVVVITTTPRRHYTTAQINSISSESDFQHSYFVVVVGLKPKKSRVNYLSCEGRIAYH